MKVPRETRILIVTDPQRPHRELTLGRRASIVLLATGLTAVVALLVLVVTYGSVANRAKQADDLALRLEEVENELNLITELRRELEAMRDTEERLFSMLGVTQDDIREPAARPGSGAAPPLSRTAEGVVTPPPAQWPVAGSVTQEFRAAGASGRAHPGIDIAQPAGTPIVAAGDGHVARAAEDPFLGHFVEIQHGLGYLTVYGHCSRVVVRVGVPVRRGQVIAYSGDTGEAAGPHLHFEVWRDGEPIDPRQVLRGDPPGA